MIRRGVGLPRPLLPFLSPHTFRLPAPRAPPTHRHMINARLKTIFPPQPFAHLRKHLILNLHHRTARQAHQMMVGSLPHQLVHNPILPQIRLAHGPDTFEPLQNPVYRWQGEIDPTFLQTQLNILNGEVFAVFQHHIDHLAALHSYPFAALPQPFKKQFDAQYSNAFVSSNTRFRKAQ